MELYRAEYQNVVFVYVSDDMEWGRTKLATRIRGGDFFLGGSLIRPEYKGLRQLKK